MTVRGRPIQTSFTPAVSGVVRVTVQFRMGWDIGSGVGGAAFCEQSAVTSYGEFVGPPKRTTQAFTASGDFPVTGGSLVWVGLAAASGSPFRMSVEDLVLAAEFFPS